MNIGVFVCGCSGNISKHTDTGKVAEEAETLDDVSFVDDQAHLCTLFGRTEGVW